MSFIDHIGASATLIASGTVQTRSIDRDLIAGMGERDPTFRERFYLSLLLTVIRRLRSLDHAMAFPT